MIEKIKDFFRELNYRIRGMEEPPEDAELMLLPITMTTERAKYEEIGFRFYKWRYAGANGKNNKMATDQVMCKAKLPEGWTIRELTGLHNEILDENGKRRVITFFKNEPWDRRGYMEMV